MVKKIRMLGNRLPGFLRNPYFITMAAFLVWLLFFDRNNLINQYRLRYELNTMRDERDFFRNEIRSDSIRLNELMSNPGSLEKFARETYLMKKENEDLFVFVEKKKP